MLSTLIMTVFLIMTLIMTLIMSYFLTVERWPELHGRGRESGAKINCTITDTVCTQIKYN